jgi:hypothetical protein
MISDAFPLDPPEEWFFNPPEGVELAGKFTVITDGPDAGRAFGLVADNSTCILNGSGLCWTAPPSPTAYEDAMQGDAVTADGNIIKTATIAMETNHVGPRASFREAVDIMANTGAAVARVRYIDTPRGPAALGAVWPGVTDLQLRKLQAAALSGDWRWRDEYDAYDFAGAIAVNNPGLPIPNRQIMAASASCECGCGGACDHNLLRFAPVAMAASLHSDHPPVVGYWRDQEETIMTITNGVPAGGDVHIHLGTTSAAHTAAVAAPPQAPAPDAPPADTAPDDLAALQQAYSELADRVAALEAWVTEDAMSEVDAMPAALPEPPELAASE